MRCWTVNVDKSDFSKSTFLHHMKKKKAVKVEVKAKHTSFSLARLSSSS